MAARRPVMRPRIRSFRGPVLVAGPVVLAVLMVASLAAVGVARPRHLDGTAEPTASSAPPTTSSAPATTPTPSPSPSPTPAPPSDDPAAAPAAVHAVDALATGGVQLGVAILDRDTGALTLGAEGATQFYSASVIKLFLITDIMHQAEAGDVTLDSDDLSLIQRALSLSDDEAMDELWEDFDGPGSITDLIGLAHLQDTQLPSDTSQWGETLISPRDVIAVYEYVLTGLTAVDRDTIMSALAGAADTGADGFDQAFGLLAPPRPATVAAKQGWMIYGSQMMLHTTGTLGSRRQYVVALLSMQPAGIGWTAGQANVDNATHALLTALGPDATG